MKIFNNPIISSILRRRNVSSEDVPQVNSDNLVGLDVNKVLYEKNRRTFSVKLEGYVEPYEVGGIKYTMFYTDVDHNLRVGERVFIVGGFYDSDDLIKIDKFNPLADGYKVLFVDRTKVALDIEYTGDLPSKTDPIDDFIKVYVASSQDEFEYLCQTYTNRGLELDLSGNDVPVSTNRFSYAYSSTSGITYSTNTILYLNGTFSTSGEFGINPTTLGNCFAILDRNSDSLVDITSDLLSGNYGQYLSDVLLNNDRIKILGTSFEVGDTEFRKNSVYYYNYDTGFWEIDREYDPAFITEQNFRRGIFRKGNFNQGVFGQYDEQIVYDGVDVRFNLGTLVNVRWVDGDINSGRSDTDSYFTAFDNGVPNIRLNTPNNGGFGYTFVYNVVMEKSNITSGVFVDSVFGSQSTSNAVADYVAGLPATYSVKITGGTFFNSELTNCDISGANLVSSVVNNSNILSSKSINSEIERSVFLRSKFTSDKIIKIDKYQESEILWWNGPNQETFKIHKFYFSEQNFNRLKNLRNFYFDGIVLEGGSNPYKLLNFFDEKFTLGSYTHSYDSIAPGGKVGAKVIIQTSTTEDNLKFFSGVTGSNSLIEEDNFEYGQPSLDILCNNLNIGFSGKTYQAFNVKDWEKRVSELLLDGGIGSYVYVSLTRTDGNDYSNITGDFVNTYTIENLSDLIDWANGPFTGSQSISNWFQTDVWGDKVIFTDNQISFTKLQTTVLDGIFQIVGSFSSNVISVQDPYIDISGAYIIDSDFKSGLFKDSEWITGNYANYNEDYSIKTNESGYYENSGVTGSTLTLNVGNKNRYDIFQEGDVAFIRGVYYDPVAAGGVGEYTKLSQTFTLDSTFNDVNGRNFVLDGLTPSGIFLDFSGQDWLVTPKAENNFNYLSPVKFENSKILSGIFRRGYFENCTFDNILFELGDRDIKNIPNARRLLITDTIFHDGGNTIKNGIYVNSSFIAGGDKFQNGVVFNSIWSGEGFNYKISNSTLTHQNIDFQDGVFTKSKWIDGVWINGQFYLNRTNTIGTQSVYDDFTEVYYSKNSLTRWSWLDGEFRNGIFERSNWESGQFINGEFFFSNFMSGEVSGGVFGKSNLKPSSTRVISGSFSNVVVINAEFKASSPLGESVIGPTPSYKIEWYSGKFDGGIFGVDVQYPTYNSLVFEYPYQSIWYNGEFNGGNFTDTAKWKLGKFNGGKFTSYFGYPEARYPYQYFTGTYSTQDRFAWEDGEFNGGEFGNASKQANSTWYTGEFNGGLFKGRYWRTGVFYNGRFEGSGIGESTMKNNVSDYISSFADSFYGFWRDGVVTENKDDHILSKNFYTQLERESTKIEKRRNATFEGILWRGGIFQHASGYMYNSVWMDGLFQKGFFVRSSFNPYVNYLTNGGFTNGLDDWAVVRGDSGPFGNSAQDLNSFGRVFVSSGNLVWNGRSNATIVYQVTNINPDEFYQFKIKIQDIQGNPTIRYGNWITPINGNFNTDSGWTLDGFEDYTISINQGNPGYIFASFSGTQSFCEATYEGAFPPEFIGLTVSVIIHCYNYVGQDSFIEILDGNGSLDIEDLDDSSSFFVLDSIIRIEKDIMPTSPDLILRFGRYNNSTFGGLSEIKMHGIIVTANKELQISPPYPQEIDIQFQSVNQFFAIEFVSEAIVTLIGTLVWQWDPSRASIDIIELVNETGGFNNSDTCLWENGTLNDSEFFVSKWENGNWIYGTGYGMIWKNGIANYMNAENIYWEGGIWKNGNWNGAPFDANWILTGSTSVVPGFAFEILQNIANYRDSIEDPEYTSIFVNNAFLSGGTDTNIIDDPEINLDGILLPQGVNNSDVASQSGTSSVLVEGSGSEWTYAKYFTDWSGGSQDLNDLTISGTYGYISSESSISNFGVVTPEPLNYIGQWSSTSGSLVQRWRDTSGYFMPYPIRFKGSTIVPNSGSGVQLGWVNAITTTPPSGNPKRWIYAWNTDNFTDTSGPGSGQKCNGDPGSQALIDNLQPSRWYSAEGYGNGFDNFLIFKINNRIYDESNSFILWSTSGSELGPTPTRNTFKAPTKGKYKFTFKWGWGYYHEKGETPSGQDDTFARVMTRLFIFKNGNQIDYIDSGEIEQWWNSGFFGNQSARPNWIDYKSETKTKSYELNKDEYITFRLIFVHKKHNSGSPNPRFIPLVRPDPSVEIEILHESGLLGSSGDPYFLQQTASQKLYARGEVGGTYSRFIFSEPGFSYNIKIKYACSYGMSIKNSSRVDFMVRCGTLSVNPIEETGGGFARIVSSVMQGIEVPENTNGLGEVQSGRKYYVGSTGIQEINYTFTPETIFTSDDDRKCLSIQKLATSDSLTRLHILSIEVVKTSISYDYEYNNATFSGISIDLEDINIPPVGTVGGGDQDGQLISIAFGNGIFKSGSFSSVWENGVWNQGLRFDKEMVYFTNLKLFGGTEKPLGFGGVVANSGSNDQAFFNNTVGNQNYTESVVSYSKNVWIITLQMSQGTITSESTNGTFTTNQGSLLPSSKFAIGDRVAVGNVAMIDSNLKRKLIRDTFTVVSIDDIERTVSLQLTLNFPIFAIKRDSDNHLIYVTKNIWLNGAFLNGFYRGVWNNGLLKGGIFITKMVDSQWIDGTFNGGWFRGLTSSIISANSSDPHQINSGLIQNFLFYGNDTKTQPYIHKWRSWVDVNFYDDSTVTIGRNTLTYDEGQIFSHLGVTFSLGEYSQTNYFSYPTYDVLSSNVVIRNNYNSNLIKLTLGQKWLEYVDYIRQIGEFRNYYNTRVQTGYDNLVEDGFTWLGRVPGPDGNIVYSEFGSNQIGFEAQDTSVVTLSTSFQDIPFVTEVSDPSGSYDSPSYTAIYSGTYLFKVIMDYQILVSPPGDPILPRDVVIQFNKYESGSTQPIQTYEEEFTISNSSGSISFESQVEMISTQFVKVRAKRLSGSSGLTYILDRTFQTLSTPSNLISDTRGAVRLRANTNAINEERLEINFDPDLMEYASSTPPSIFYGLSLDHTSTSQFPRERYNYISFDLEGQIQTTGLTENDFIFEQNKMIFTFVTPQNTPVESDGNNLLQRIPDQSLSISGSVSSVSSLLVIEKTPIKEYFYGKRRMNLLSVGNLLGPDNFSEGGALTASNFLAIGKGQFFDPVEATDPEYLYGAFPIYKIGGGGSQAPFPQYLEISRDNLISWQEYFNVTNIPPSISGGGPFSAPNNIPSGTVTQYLQDIYGNLPAPQDWPNTNNNTFDFFNWYRSSAWFAYNDALGDLGEDPARNYAIGFTWVNNDFDNPGFDFTNSYGGQFTRPDSSAIIDSPSSAFPKFEDMYFVAPQDGKYTFALTASFKQGYPGQNDPATMAGLNQDRYVWWNVGFVKRDNQNNPLRYYSIFGQQNGTLNKWPLSSGLKCTNNDRKTEFEERTICLKAGERVDIMVTFSFGGNWLHSSAEYYYSFLFYMMTPNISGTDVGNFEDTRWYFSCTGFTPNSCSEEDDSGLTPKTKLLLSNLKFIETDMIPFFQLVRTDSTNLDLQGNPIDIDTSIQTPLQGVAPFIDNSNPNFQFINNINFSGSIFVPVPSTTTPTATTATSATTRRALPAARLSRGG